MKFHEFQVFKGTFNILNKKKYIPIKIKLSDIDSYYNWFKGEIEICIIRIDEIRLKVKISEDKLSRLLNNKK